MDDSLHSARRLLFWSEDPRVRGIVENVADGVVGIDTQGNIELFNPAAERLFGFSTADVMGRNVRMLMPAQYGDHHDGYLEHYLQTGERRIIGIGREVTGRRKDGSIFPMYLSVGEIRLPEHNGFIGIVHDLSAQKAAERELAGAGRFLQAIIDSMPSALVGVDSEGRVTHWSRVAADELGITSEGAIGRPFAELFPFLGLELRDIRQAIDAGSPVRKERVPVPGGGTTRYLDVMVYPLVHDTCGAVVRIDDVSERVRIEEMMVQTEKMMSVGGLAAGMAHEINNPLGIVSQGCQNVNRRVSTDIAESRAVAAELGIDMDKLQEYLTLRGIFRFLDGIREAFERANRIVTDMLAYSRRNASSFVPVHLNGLLDTVLRLASHDYDLKENYDFRRIPIRRETVGESDRICCDEMAIEQVFRNRRATPRRPWRPKPPDPAARNPPEGGGRRRAGLRRGGTTVPESTNRRRATCSSRSSPPSRSASAPVSACRWSILSSPNNIVAPWTCNRGRDGARASSSACRGKGDPMAPLVIVVDAEASIGDNLAVFLEDEGMQVHVVFGRRRAARIGTGLPVQVCIMDLRLPGMNGAEAIRTIRRSAPHIRFIVHTGSTQTPSSTICFVPGSTTFRCSRNRSRTWPRWRVRHRSVRTRMMQAAETGSRPGDPGH